MAHLGLNGHKEPVGSGAPPGICGISGTIGVFLLVGSPGIEARVAVQVAPLIPRLLSKILHKVPRVWATLRVWMPAALTD